MREQLGEAVRDVRRAARSLLRRPGLALITTLTLSIGIGLFAAAYTIIDAALFRAPPFEHAESLAILYTTRARQGEDEERFGWSWPRILELRQSARSFSDIASYTSSSLNLSGTDEPADLVRGEFVTPSYHDVLAVRPQIGRPLLDTDDAQPVVLLGYDLWQRHFDGDAGIIGRTIRVSSTPLTVVGVMPRGFAGVSGVAELWISATMAPQLTYLEYLTTPQNFIRVIGRLAPGVTLDEARAELDVIGARLGHQDPDDATTGATALSLNEARTSSRVRQALQLLFAAIAMLYLLACANVSSLLLERAVSRQHELAVRRAMGSGSPRIVWQLTLDGALIAIAGGIAGLVVAYAITQVITAPAGGWSPRPDNSIGTFDAPVFNGATIAFGLAAIVLTTLIVSAAPVMMALRRHGYDALRDGSRATDAGSLSLRRLSPRGAVVALEGALAVVLVVLAALLAESALHMRAFDTGIDPSNVLTFEVQPSEALVPPERAPSFIGRLLDEIAVVPGVISATVDGGSPLAGSARNVLFIDGREIPSADDAPAVRRHYVGPDHFRTLGIPLLHGRTFTREDIAGRPGVAIISESAARRFFPDEDPIGKRIWFAGSGFEDRENSVEIVGIVGDVRYDSFEATSTLDASVYTPAAQFTYSWRTVFVRTRGSPMQYVDALRQAVQRVDTEVPIFAVQPMSTLMGSSWARSRFNAWLYGAFAMAALLLAASGIHAVVAFAVASRTRELGIRQALGATPASIMRLVVVEGISLPVVGAAIGIVASLALTRLLTITLYGVTPTEPRVFLIATCVIVIVAMLACVVPALRAVRVDPARALRA